MSANLHVPVAKLCIDLKRPLVTASYISPEMQALHSAAQSAGVLLLNEIGLDPGLDHLTAMKMIREARAEGYGVESFVSWCGGLPAPEDASNCLGYKFSWSPRGVLLAAQNSARFLRQGQVIEVDGSELLLSAERVNITPGFAFEGLPNRDSLKYRDLYGIPEAQTMMRGTLRYEGFSALLHQFKGLGLLSQKPVDSVSWIQYIKSTLGVSEISPKTLMNRLELTLFEAQRLYDALQWLHVLSPEKLITSKTPFDSFCALLQQKLAFGPGERDLVLLHHDFTFKNAQGTRKRKTATICEYGQRGGASAMARTVGIPVAVAGRLILEGGIKATGVQAPISTDYAPILWELEKHFIIK